MIYRQLADMQNIESMWALNSPIAGRGTIEIISNWNCASGLKKANLDRFQRRYRGYALIDGAADR